MGYEAKGLTFQYISTIWAIIVISNTKARLFRACLWLDTAIHLRYTFFIPNFNSRMEIAILDDPFWPPYKVRDWIIKVVHPINGHLFIRELGNVFVSYSWLSKGIDQKILWIGSTRIIFGYIDCENIGQSSSQTLPCNQELSIRIFLSQIIIDGFDFRLNAIIGIFESFMYLESFTVVHLGLPDGRILQDVRQNYRSPEWNDYPFIPVTLLLQINVCTQCQYLASIIVGHLPIFYLSPFKGFLANTCILLFLRTCPLNNLCCIVWEDAPRKLLSLRGNEGDIAHFNSLEDSYQSYD